MKQIYNAEPIRNRNDVEAIGRWMESNAAKEYADAYWNGVRTGARLNGVNRQGFLAALRIAAKDCGVPIHVGVHTPRKTFGYLHFLENCDLPEIQRIFGHSSSENTAKYIGLVAE